MTATPLRVTPIIRGENLSLKLSQIILEYRQGVKKSVLTPSRKHVGRTVARRSRSALVAEVLRDPIAKQYLIKCIGMIIRKELVLMCSDKTNSILGSQLDCDLKEFTWDKLFEELSFNAPSLLSILRACTQTRRPRTNRSALIRMYFAILLKYRYLKINLIQKIIGERSEPLSDKLGGEICIATRALVCIYIYMRTA